MDITDISQTAKRIYDTFLYDIFTLSDLDKKIGVVIPEESISIYLNMGVIGRQLYEGHTFYYILKDPYSKRDNINVRYKLERIRELETDLLSRQGWDKRDREMMAEIRRLTTEILEETRE